MRCDRRTAAATCLGLLISISALAQSPDNPVLVYKKKYVMGTVFEIVAYDQSPEHASLVIEKAFQEIVRLDDLLSDYKPDSGLNQLNRSAHFHMQEVTPDLYRIINESVKFSRLSGGKFDITVAPLVNLWKAALRGEAIPTRSQQEAVRSCVGYESIELIPPNRIRFQSPCLRLDLGSIGKGYAVDRAADVLRASGIRDALINAGGSTILGMGSPPNQTGWLIHLRDPSHKIDPHVILKDTTVSTSEQTAPSLLGNETPGHIVDPETGMPLKTDLAVSAVANNATASDALSTTLLLVGPTKGKAIVKNVGNVSAVWISPAARVETAIGGPQILFENGASAKVGLSKNP